MANASSFNLELMVDSASDAFVGISARDTEDSAAVAETFGDGAITAADAPLALLLDNRPSNHTPEVDAALKDTLRIRATPERPQNKTTCCCPQNSNGRGYRPPTPGVPL